MDAYAERVEAQSLTHRQAMLIVLGVLVAIFLLAPGARAVEHAFFSPQHMWQSFVGNPQQGYAPPPGGGYGYPPGPPQPPQKKGKGCLIADVSAIVGSIDVVMGEIDR